MIDKNVNGDEIRKVREALHAVYYRHATKPTVGSYILYCQVQIWHLRSCGVIE